MTQKPNQLADVEDAASQVVAGVRAGRIDAGVALTALRPLIPATATRQFTPELFTIRTQLGLLRYFNQKCWANALGDRHFDAVDTESDHMQTLEDLELLYVDFGSMAVSLQMWWRVFTTQWPLTSCPRPELIDGRHIVPNASARGHDLPMPAIIRMRIDLMSFWRPESPYTVSEAREMATRTGTVLAGVETLAAVALCQDLAKHLDGKTLPYPRLGGLEAVTGSKPDGWNVVPVLYWVPSENTLCLGTVMPDAANGMSSVPRLLSY